MGISDRKKREKEQRKTQIIEAAENLFYLKGYSATTMQEIADMAELSKGTLYLYFKNKEELLLEVGNKAAESMQSIAEEALKGKETGRERFEALIWANITWYKKHPEQFNLFSDAMQHLRPYIDDPENLKKVVEHDEKYAQMAITAVEQGLEDRSISNIKSPFDHVMVVSVLQWGLLQFLKDKGDIIERMYGYNLDEIIKYAHEVLFSHHRK